MSDLLTGPNTIVFRVLREYFNLPDAPELKVFERAAQVGEVDCGKSAAYADFYTYYFSHKILPTYVILAYKAALAAQVQKAAEESVVT